MTIRYRHSDFLLIRSTTDPGNLDLPGFDPGDPGAVAATGRVWLAKNWSRDEVREALTIASPDLASHIDRVLAAGADTSPRDLRRAVTSAASYLLRWMRRPTPFGMFAGIAPVTTGTLAKPRAHQWAVAHADAAWVEEMACRLERDPALFPALTVVADNTAAARDGRVLVTRRADPTARLPEPAREASVRYTRPVQAALEIAAVPVRLEDLASQLCERFPGVQPARTRALLETLVGEGFLITSVHPPMTSSDPLAWMIRALRRAGARNLPGTAPLLRDLEQIHMQLRAHDGQECSETAAALRTDISGRMSALMPTGQYPLAVDVSVGGSVHVPVRVLDEAAAAAGVLLRLTTRPFGSMAWVEYHARFRERYGPGTLVPVTELLSESGLGYPDGYLNARRNQPAHRMLSERDAVLLRLIQQAAADGSDEITLDEPVIESLIIDDHAYMVPPQRVELGVTLHARSAGALSRGDFELRVVSAPRVPTSMAGRFAHLLSPGERALLTAAYRSDEEESAMAVQLSFPPRLPRAGNVVRVAPLLDHVVPLGEHPPDDGTSTVAVEDLAVTADATQMYLVHRPTGRRVVPLIPHALEMTTRTPPLARFLAQIADARTAGFGPFDPGAARVFRYLPRIRYRRTVLSPARWRLTAADVSSDPGTWHERLNEWRQRWRVPARVIVADGELRLPLDLDQPLDRGLLRLQLARAGRLELREDTPPEGNDWFGKPAELLIPLILGTPPKRNPPVTAPAGKAYLPGDSSVICAHLTGNPDRFSDVIGAHLPRLAAALAPLTERWWVRRYRDMIHPWSPQHIAISVRLISPRAFAGASAEIAAFASGLSSRGLPGELALTPYREHPARYGDGEAMTAAERVFAADTIAAITQIEMAVTVGVAGQALAAASMAQLAATFAATTEGGYRALTTTLPRGSGPLDRHARDLACRLADPSGGFKALRALPGGDSVADAWAERDAELTAYHQALSRQREPRTVLRSLLHEHHMRAVGLDPETEKQTGRLARAAALQRLALTAGPR